MNDNNNGVEMDHVLTLWIRWWVGGCGGVGVRDGEEGTDRYRERLVRGKGRSERDRERFWVEERGGELG